jgi:hypothetical protein
MIVKRELELVHIFPGKSFPSIYPPMLYLRHPQASFLEPVIDDLRGNVTGKYYKNKTRHWEIMSEFFKPNETRYLKLNLLMVFLLRLTHQRLVHYPCLNYSNVI